MTEIRHVGQDVQAEILKTVRKSQEAVIDAIRAWADTVRSFTPPMPDMNLPFAEKLPKPEEFVDSAYDFAEKLLASQRKFAEDVLHATAALIPWQSEAGAKNGAPVK